MIVDVEVPQQGLTITEATLIRWARQPGETVTAGELLFEIETDKAVVEVESPDTGRLLTCLAAEGDVVPLGGVVAKLGTEATDTLEAPAPPTVAQQAAEPPPARTSSNGHAPAPAASGVTRPVASPRARRAADQLGVDLATVCATGRRGLHIRERDVLLAAEHRDARLEPAQTPAPVPRLKRLTAQRTAASFRDVPHFYLTREISAERLLAFRADIAADIEAHAGVRVTVTDLLLRAVAIALKTHPTVNAQWDGEGAAPLATIDVGLAVDTPDGLTVPVIRRADALSLAETAQRRAELVERARQGRSRPDDLTGGSFTVSNLGAGGVDQFDAIINAPQSGILSAGAIKTRPYVVNGTLAAVPTLILTASLDHRVVDGAEAARFLSRIADLLESPGLLCAW